MSARRPKLHLASITTAVAVALAAALLAPAADGAGFAGQNGKIAFDRDGVIYTVSQNGSGQTQLTNGGSTDSGPAWSPDGTKIAFHSNRDGNLEIYKMNADGTGVTRVTNNAAADFNPTWSPDGTKIAFISNRTGPQQVWVMNFDGSNPTALTNVTTLPDNPEWSPDGTRVAFNTEGAPGEDIYTIKVDGTGLTNIAPSPSDDVYPTWSPNDATIAFLSNRDTHSDHLEVYKVPADGGTAVRLTVNNFAGGYGLAWSPYGQSLAVAFQPNGIGKVGATSGSYTSVSDVVGAFESAHDWQPLPANYPRVKSATPWYIPLVPAMAACTTPNTAHKDLFSSSCDPPAQSSSYLTVGTPDFNLQPAKSVNSLKLQAYCRGGALNEPPPCSTTLGDQLDGKVTLSLTDVRCTGASGTNCAGGALSDFVGSVEVRATARITDQDSYGAGSATIVDLPLNFGANCVATSDTTIGSTCLTITTLETVMGGNAIVEGARSTWHFDDFRVYDGGADGSATTAAGNTLFLWGGLFFP